MQLLIMRLYFTYSDFFVQRFMNLLIATGIYPPEIGGIATYAKELAHVLRERGHRVTVMTYGSQSSVSDDVIVVSKQGNILVRWSRYARALRCHAKDADAVIALSSVSVGIPVILARLKKSKKILRLGGDFFWERYTDAGGMKSLREWYETRWGFWRLVNTFIMGFILCSFDHIVYSTRFQQELHEEMYRSLPTHSVIDNAIPVARTTQHSQHDPFKILCMTRFVGFKNLFSLIDALHQLPSLHCTFVGSGPLELALRARVQALSLQNRVTRIPPVAGTQKGQIFNDHDLLVIPSTTEISPNTALEARASGLPVLLTTETGLSSTLTEGMVVRSLRTPTEIKDAIEEVLQSYSEIAHRAGMAPANRDWSVLASEWENLFTTLRR